MSSESNYQASATKDIIRTENTSEPRKKRKERGSKSSRVLSDDDNFMLDDDVQKKKTSVSRQLMDKNISLKQDMHYCFKATICEIENKSKSWYEACASCLKAIIKTTKEKVVQIARNHLFKLC
ncbi:uncharacterized protein [Primulina huaijiensis]|uniref:uncharacterized protein n=1 Tax=Primulina huaijiensis TaxID=1492673 RepID=UPI003CC746CC